MRVLDRIAHNNAWSSRGTGGKAALCLGLMATALLGSPPFAALLVLLTTAILARMSARVPAAVFLGMLLIPASFLVTTLPMLAISVSWQEGLLLTWSATGARNAVLLGLRSLATLAAMLLLALTTPPMRLLTLGKKLGVSSVFIDLAMLTYRLLFVLGEMAATGFQSQSFRLGYQGWRRSLRSLALLVAGLLGRTLHQARRMETGLAARGYAGNLPVLSSAPQTLPGEWLWAVALPGGILLVSRELARYG
ncbi:MAG: cobalt ECF transporter T component CbiQ [Magnetococcales bacterium]|nr:cobalt ECF transporter T component CbiQ [Magnetococcales bacterium]MBF0154848.1 cobalt ECF transporter T component CbiQ [Magnetococcales bacterium]